MLRLCVALLVATLLQTTVAPNVHILGANPDFALIVVACVGLQRGCEVGALFGFVGGGLVSLVLFEPLGVSSFVFVIVGYLAGRYAETADLAGVATPVVTVFAASILGQILFTLTQFLLARQVPFYYVATRVIAPAVILDTLLAAPMYVATRWWLRGEGVRRVHEAA
jgi:rod shape-determining protein MreD